MCPLGRPVNQVTKRNCPSQPVFFEHTGDPAPRGGFGGKPIGSPAGGHAQNDPKRKTVGEPGFSEFRASACGWPLLEGLVRDGCGGAVPGVSVREILTLALIAIARRAIVDGGERPSRQQRCRPRSAVLRTQAAHGFHEPVSAAMLCALRSDRWLLARRWTSRAGSRSGSTSRTWASRIRRGPSVPLPPSAHTWLVALSPARNSIAATKPETPASSPRRLIPARPNASARRRQAAASGRLRLGPPAREPTPATTSPRRPASDASAVAASRGNERIEQISDQWNGGTLHFVCECLHTGCTKPLPMTRDEYEAIAPLRTASRSSRAMKTPRSSAS